MIKILHTSDWHIDGGHNYGDPERSFSDRVTLLKDIVNKAIGEKVNVILHTGDIADTSHPTTRTIKELQNIVKMVTSAGIHFIDVAGNHESHKTSASPSVGELLAEVDRDKVHIMTRPEMIYIEGIQFCCVPWMHRSHIQAVDKYRTMSRGEVVAEMSRMATEMIATLVAGCNQQWPIVVACHATVEGGEFGQEREIMTGTDFCLPISAFADVAIDYVALGHIHKRQALNEKTYYAGSPDRMSFGEKNDEKGFNLVEFFAASPPVVTFGQTNARQFVEYVVAWDAVDVFIDTIDAEAIKNAVVKFIVTGSDTECAKVDMAAIEKRFNEMQVFAIQVVKNIIRTDRKTRIDNSADLSVGHILGTWAKERAPKLQKKLLAQGLELIEDVSTTTGARLDVAGFVPRALHLENFCSHERTDLNFDSFNLAVLAGDNGAGKSSLIEALAWCIWGYSRAGSDDDLVRLGQKNMVVALDFRLGEDAFTITRKRTVTGKTAKPSLEVIKNGEPVTRATIAETQDYIIGLVGMNADVFFASAYLRQGHAGDFTTARPAERKTILADILSLDLWQHFEERVKNERRQAEERLTTFKTRKQAVEEELAKEDELLSSVTLRQSDVELAKEAASAARTELEEITTALQELEKAAAIESANSVRRAEYQRRIDQAKKELAEINESNTAIDELIADARKVIASEPAARKSLGILPGLEREIQTLEKVRDRNTAIKMENTTIESMRTFLTQQIKSAEAAQAKNVEEGKRRKQELIAAGTDCPTCGAHKEHQHKNPHAAIEKDLERLRGEYRELTAQISEATTKLAALNLQEVPFFSEQILEDKRAEYKRHSEIAKDAVRCEAAKREIETLEKQQAGYLLKELNLPREIDEDTDRLNALPPASDGASEMKEALLKECHAKKTDLERLTEAVTRATNLLAIAENKVAELATKRKELKEWEKESAADIEAVEILALLSEAAGKRGCPALIIESVLPEIETAANEILQRISNGNLHVRFETQRQKKSATMKEVAAGENSITETLDIFVEDAEGERELEMFSGGERFRANFAIRIALAKMLASRSGVQNRILLIDEGGSELDEEGKLAFVAAIREISNDFEKVLVISHIEDIIEAFDTKITVSKTAGVTGISFS